MMITTAIAIVKNKIKGAKEERVFPSYEALMESISTLSILKRTLFEFHVNIFATELSSLL